jgi:hypothetical protein
MHDACFEVAGGEAQRHVRHEAPRSRGSIKGQGHAGDRPKGARHHQHRLAARADEALHLRAQASRRVLPTQPDVLAPAAPAHDDDAGLTGELVREPSHVGSQVAGPEALVDKLLAAALNRATFEEYRSGARIFAFETVRAGGDGQVAWALQRCPTNMGETVLMIRSEM